MLLENIVGRTNIKSLVLEGPGPKLISAPFDPERDLNQKDWGEMKGIFNKEVNYESQLSYISQVKLLFPERIGELNFGAEDWNHIKDSVASYVEALSGRTGTEFALLLSGTQLISTLAYALSVFPSEEAEIRRLSEENKIQVREHIQMLHRQLINDPEVVPDFVLISFVGAAMLYPDLDSKDPIRSLIYDPATINKLKDLLESRPRDPDNDFENDIASLARFRLLYPHFQPNIQISASDWKHMNDALRRLIGEGDINLAEMASSMKILAAERVGINQRGEIEIVMPLPKHPLAQSIPPLPETRKF